MQEIQFALEGLVKRIVTIYLGEWEVLRQTARVVIV